MGHIMRKKNKVEKMKRDIARTWYQQYRAGLAVQYFKSIYSPINDNK